MTGTLKVEPSTLISTASSFSSKATEVQTLTGQMTELVTSLTGEIWTGEAQTQYLAKFNGLQDDITRMIAMINEHATDLQDMATKYQTAESANEELIATLSSDVIV